MLPNYLDNICETWEPVGSRITCNPAPTDTDQDILVLLTKEQWPTFLEELKANHWTKCEGKKEPVPNPPQLEDYPSVAVWYDAYTAWGDKYGKELDDEGYGDIGDGASFEAWRLGELNVILTMDEFWFDKFMEASDCCKALNVMDKQERVAIFNRIVPASKPPVKKQPVQVDWVQTVEATAPPSLATWNSLATGNTYFTQTYTIPTTYDF